MAFNQVSPSIRFSLIEESELSRINELSNIPEIAENFETIPPVSMETTRALWNYIQSGIVSLWGIHLHDWIIGGVGFHAQPPGTRLSHIATFFLYLEPAYWGKGIGKESIQFLEKVVQNRGYLRIECMVSGRNQRAISLYKKLGYKQEGIKKQAFYIDGEYADLIIMGKVFSTKNV
jgi:putative acetyltransferase